MPKAVLIPCEIEETDSRFGVIDAQTFDNRIDLRMIQYRDNCSKIMITHEFSPAEDSQGGDDFRDGGSRVWGDGGGFVVVEEEEVCGGNRGFGEDEGREGSENLGNLKEIEGLPFVDVVEHMEMVVRV